MPSNTLQYTYTAKQPPVVLSSEALNFHQFQTDVTMSTCI